MVSSNTYRSRWVWPHHILLCIYNIEMVSSNIYRSRHVWPHHIHRWDVTRAIFQWMNSRVAKHAHAFTSALCLLIWYEPLTVGHKSQSDTNTWYSAVVHGTQSWRGWGGEFKSQWILRKNKQTKNTRQHAIGTSTFIMSLFENCVLNICHKEKKMCHMLHIIPFLPLLLFFHL